MKNSFLNLRTILAGAVIAACVLFSGCVRGSSSGDGGALTAEFFSGEIKGEITVSAYDSMLYKSYLEEAARLFEERYPGTKVNIETFSAMPEVRTSQQGNTSITVTIPQDDRQSEADYLSRIYTKIMSGNGADIYAMDILPLHKFTESGTLENLEPYMNMDPCFNKADYRRNILEALRYMGGIWFLPLAYNFSYISYDSSLIPAELASGFGIDKAWNTEELIKLGSVAYDGTYKLLNITDYEMFFRLFRENIRSFVNAEGKQANFTDGRFSELLKLAKKYGEEGFIFQRVTGQRDANDVINRMMDTMADRFFFKMNSGMFLIDQYRRDSGMRRMFPYYVDDNDEIAGIQALADGSVLLHYSKGFGINSHSKNKAASWAFLKFLLSDEMQSSASLGLEFPLSNKAREEKTELVFSGAFFGIAADLNSRQRQDMEDCKAAMERLSDKINSFMIWDTNIDDMIASAAQYFFEGSRTAEETARILQNKTALYLSE